MIFGKICDISIDDTNTWQNKIFLTFDTDWCSDDVLSFTLNILEEYDIKATFFITNYTPVLDRIRSNPKIELGIHPNFNPLLQGDFRYGKTYVDVIEYYLAIVPDAVSVRSHSMTQNSPILDAFEKYGLIYDCNHFIPFKSGITLKPWKHWNGNIIKIPYFWEDDIHFIYQDDWNLEKILNVKGLKVFDFHPIHVYLNTDHIERYEKAKKYSHDHSRLSQHINEGSGTRDLLIDIIERVVGR
jgi:hypothetical protein